MERQKKNARQDRQPLFFFLATTNVNEQEGTGEDGKHNVSLTDAIQYYVARSVSKAPFAAKHADQIPYDFVTHGPLPAADQGGGSVFAP